MAKAKNFLTKVSTLFSVYIGDRQDYVICFNDNTESFVICKSGDESLNFVDEKFTEMASTPSFYNRMDR